ncbi:3-hydroxyacyl-CoA dehydrogenase NAD-binding domain-containing protein [Roseisolibacter sp. H3M3-2]|uniref:3-hydroxyacyl-CoA dehydrogenase NAD-binding domain-containing protein n=1 Tax=Roseisolibacter sp. H3M3-2 TaxID=3031323 RepID=UPI0023DC30D1|nr:3-hydroxyacyl-CoA dehydrogenase NAD-binding domain-containing protein [Roseisolibacter sp. H3M3-2]MDF1503936.1 3-hydroxyacyl-CoA dehydrogenase NAD-binding domain-containing protein [Roseisolibacter sp. H3M3-2]
MSDRTSEQVHPALALEIAGGVAVATFDLPGSAVNVLGAAAAEAFGALLDRVDRDPSVRAVVLLSGKPDAWIAGADIEQFAHVREAGDGEALSRQGQALVDRVERSRAPVVAAIHGAALGGGLEVALACAWRVATDHPKTTFALPEVQLGLIPGMGGTQRLPRRVGLQTALDMILTGRTLRGRKALAIGLIDDLVHPAVLREVALRRARELAEGARAPAEKPRRHGAGGALRGIVLEDNALGRTVVFSKAREGVTRKTRGHFPAPLAALDVVHEGYARGLEAGLREEARRFGELAAGPVSRELVYLFHATTALKKDPGADAAARPVRALGVIGGGFMGAGIAAVAARQGTPVRLKDADLPRVAQGLDTVRGILAEALARKRVTRPELAQQQALVTGTADDTGFRHADLVIEAVFEDLAVKRRVLNAAERVAPSAVLASNTSTIPIGRLADGLEDPTRLVGMHFFSPVQKMPLLEVVEGTRSSPESVATAVAYAKRLGKTAIVVRDGPGFYVNRILAPYLNEAGWLLEEGVAVDAVDQALVKWGFPVGPFQLMDEVGLEVAARAGAVVGDAFGARLAPAPALRRVLESGRPGRKGKVGFYAYDADGARRGVDASVYAVAGVPATRAPAGRAEDGTPAGPTAAEIVERTVYPMLDEAVRCLAEGIVRSRRDGDVGAVFGIGYPPFRGGPFRTLDALGAETVVRALQVYAARHGGGRFAPSEGLREMTD